jgi:hypothetical protein
VSDEVHLTSIEVDGQRVLIYPNWIGPEFFQTMGIPILRGRAFNASDKDSVIISESLARRRWPNEDPIGKAWKDSKIDRHRRRWKHARDGDEQLRRHRDVLSRRAGTSLLNVSTR